MHSSFQTARSAALLIICAEQAVLLLPTDAPREDQTCDSSMRRFRKIRVGVPLRRLYIGAPIFWETSIWLFLKMGAPTGKTVSSGLEHGVTSWDASVVA